MRSWALLAAGILAVTGSAVALWPTAQAQEPTAGASTQRSLTQARAEATRARERANALDREARTATQASERATIAAAALAARVQQAEAALASADAQLAIVRDQRRALDRRLAHERAPIAQLLAGLQTQARQPALLTLLQPGSIQDAVHLRAVVAAVGPQIDARTAALRRSLARAQSLETSTRHLVTERAALQSGLLAQRKELVALAAAERIRARRSAGAADREAERAFAIGEQARDLSMLVRRLGAADVQRDAASRPRAASASGPVPYRLPVEAPASQAAAGTSRSVRLLARPGAMVVAPAAGRVAFAGPYRGYGEIVIVEHSAGWTSLVTGLAKAQVAVGQRLVAGSPLGQAPARDPRIGLELRRNGQRVNPLDQLR